VTVIEKSTWHWLLTSRVRTVYLKSGYCSQLNCCRVTQTIIVDVFTLNNLHLICVYSSSFIIRRQLLRNLIGKWNKLKVKHFCFWHLNKGCCLVLSGINGGWFQMFKKVTFQSIIYTVEKVPLTFFVNTRGKLK